MEDIQKIISDKSYDKLDRIFHLQKAFDDQLAESRNLNFSKEEWVQKEVLAMISELAELLDEVNYKWWKNKKELNIANVKEELIDVLHFFMAACIKVGMTPDEIHEIYIAKNRENFARQQGTSAKKGYCKDE